MEEDRKNLLPCDSQYNFALSTDLNNIDIPILDERKYKVIGYDLFSSFEIAVRDYIAFTYSKLYGNNWLDKIPENIRNKVNEKIEVEGLKLTDIVSFINFLEYTDFPHLKELFLQKDFYVYVTDFFGEYSKDIFINNMDEIYNFRNKIMHPRRHFSYSHLLALFSLLKEMSKGNHADDYLKVMHDIIINTDISESKYKLFENLNTRQYRENLPFPDYDLEGGFIGRKESINILKKMIYSDLDRVITISGAGGVGKTALALELVYSIIDDQKNPFDFIVWTSAKEEKLTPLGIEAVDTLVLKTYDYLLDTIIKVSSPDIYSTISSMLKESDESIKDQKINNEEYVKEILENSTALIVIDNLETIRDEKIIDFIKNIPRPNKILITSRRGLGEIERRYELKELSTVEAIQLMRVISRVRKLNTIMKASDEVLQNYVNKVQCYPLAIKWCLGQISYGKDVTNVFENVTHYKSELIKFCFKDIFEILSQDAKKILYAISIFDDTPSRELLNYVVDMDNDSFDDEIKNLILLSLIAPEQEFIENQFITKYYILSLTRNYIREDLENHPGLKDILIRRYEEIQLRSSEAERARVLYKHSLFGAIPKTEREQIALVKCQAAYNLSQSGNYNDALKILDDLKKMAPSFTPIYRYSSIVYADSGDISKANDMMKIATDLEPKNDSLWFAWGNLNKKYRRYNDAYKYLKQAMDLNPTDKQYSSTLAMVQRNRGYYKEAYDLFISSISNENGGENSPRHNIINYYGLSDLLQRWSIEYYKNMNYTESLNKLDEAEQYSIKALKIDDEDLRLKYILNSIRLSKALTLYKSDKYKALDEIKKILGNINRRLIFRDRHVISRAYYYYVVWSEELVEDPNRINKQLISILNESLKYTDPQDQFYNKVAEKKAFYLDRLNREAVNIYDIKIGTINRYIPQRNYGFITSNDKDTYFFHQTDLCDNLRELSFEELINKKVNFNIQDSNKTHKRAVNIQETDSCK